MKFGEVHEDMERFLQEDCYCPNEIYGIDGFFYMLFTKDDDCFLIEQSDKMTAVVCTTSNGKTIGEPQAIMIWHDGDTPERVVDAQRVDATENNIGILRSIVRGEKPDGRTIDEFEPGKLQEQVSKVLDIADAVMVG